MATTKKPAAKAVTKPAEKPAAKPVEKPATEAKAPVKAAAPAKPVVAEKPATTAKLPTTKDTTAKIETKAGVMKETPEKAPAKKAPAKKAPAKKVELKTSYTVEFVDGRNFTEKEIIKRVKESWTKDFKKKVGDLKSIELYIKQEENAVYFVANNEISGKVDLV